MKVNIGDFLDRFGGNIIIVLAIFSLLSPGSASVLCVAPDGHVEIENISAKCCASSHISDPAATDARNKLGLTDNCGNCTDLFMIPSGREAIPKSHCDAASSSPAGECLGNQLPAELSLSQFRQCAISSIDGLNLSSFFLRLRC